MLPVQVESFFANHSSLVKSFYPEISTSPERVSWAVSMVMSRTTTTLGAGQPHCMVPLMDMMNHRRELNPPTHTASLIDWQTDEPLIISFAGLAPTLWPSAKLPRTRCSRRPRKPSQAAGRSLVARTKPNPETKATASLANPHVYSTYTGFQ